MKAGRGTYLTHVLNGTQSERCHPDQPHRLHYPSMNWYLQFTRSESGHGQNSRDGNRAQEG